MGMDFSRPYACVTCPLQDAIRSVLQPLRMAIPSGWRSCPYEATLSRFGLAWCNGSMGMRWGFMRQKHVPISIDLAAGQARDRVLTCDLSREYITINADYHT